MAFVDPDEQTGQKKQKFSDPDESAFKRFLANDPIKKMAPYYLGPLGLPRAVMDASSALEKLGYEAGGKVTDVATDFGASPELAAGLGTVANTGFQTLPMAPIGSIAKVGAPLVSKVAKSLMHSSLKPSTASPAKGAAAVNTMLDDGYNVSAGSLEAMKTRIGDLNKEVEAAIAASTAKVKKNEVAAYTQDAVQRFANRPEAVQAIKAAQDAEQTFVTHPMQVPGPTMTVQDAQKMKQGYQASIGERGYGEIKTPATEMDKAIARGLREKISQEVPEVAAKNAKEAELINAAKRLQARLAVEANKNPIGLGALISQPWMLPMWMWDRSAFAKSLAARGLYAGQEQIPAGLARGGVGGAQLFPGLYETPQE
jgi:hypothetical protein